ncbi:MAG: imidazole glycerol phosphate synthase subunit HisH [Peptococcaceae bacterium]|jgi:glutamine amidotransferase|nr:imidazole glycerol phosphate synthase subunit HisH [Peptococcaceae bacterium]
MAGIKIIDYKAGNAPSVYHAVKRLGFEADLARTPEDIRGATHIILPGVGSAGATMESLHETGFTGALGEAVLDKKVFFLGICVGIQILFEHSEEDDARCLGWLKGRVARFDAHKVRVPQMGWNRVRFIKETPCPAREGYFYFVNSYHVLLEDPDDLWGEADYDGPFTAAVRRGNIYAAQFHVEKSGEAGLELLRGYLSLHVDDKDDSRGYGKSDGKGDDKYDAKGGDGLC